MRGEVRQTPREAVLRRITPACAGRRSCSSQSPAAWEDHPRVCREKLSFSVIIVYHSGSPPRVRGEVQLLHDRVKQLRITPACAGRSNIISIDMSMNWDHPRVRGEKQTHIFSRIRSQGSPPRARGEVARPVAPLKNRGITPACAGRRGRAMRCFYTSRDHPRVCGEKLTGKNGAQTEKGSPPRVRGEAGEPAFPAFHLRITPRVCGEKAGLCQDFF